MTGIGPRRIALLAALLGAVSTAPVRGQSCTVNGTANCNINSTVTIQIGAATMVALPGSTITLNTPYVPDYDAGYQDSPGPSATVRANRSWRLYISASTASGYWTAAGGAWASKPAGDLRWALASGGPYTSLLVSPGSAQIGSGAAATAGTSIPLYFRTSLDWLRDTPGTYTLTVMYTLTAP